jgi:hypothetical protein
MVLIGRENATGTFDGLVCVDKQGTLLQWNEVQFLCLSTVMQTTVPPGTFSEKTLLHNL